MLNVVCFSPLLTDCFVLGLCWAYVAIFDPIRRCLGPSVGLCRPSWPHRRLSWAYVDLLLGLC